MPDDAQLLPCGVAVDVLLEQISDAVPAPDPEHQATCPHCRAALGQLAQIWQPVADYAARQIQAPPELLGSVLAQVRGLARDGRHALLVGPLGRTRIASWVVSTVARRQALAVPEVLDAVGRVGVAGGTVVVALDVVVAYGPDLQAVADEVRTTVSRTVAAFTGLHVAQVDVQVSDVHVSGQELVG